MKRIIGFAGGGLLVLLLVIVARTMTIAGAAAPGEADLAPAAADNAAQRLSEAIKFQTISWSSESAPDAEAFAGFAAFLEDAYPAVHRVVTREIIGGHSLLYRWPGVRGDEKPIGLIAHIDVVPVEAGTESGWTHPAFSGVIADGAVWGRGALDNKGQLIAMMEAAERLAASGFIPARDIYFLFGHDEELGGFAGAGEIAARLKARGAHFEWTLDEGSGLVDGIIPGVARPVALISIAEKGSTTLRISAIADGGHSSAPGKDTAVSLVARAVARVTDNPYPLELDQNITEFLHAIAGELPFAPRAVLANLWLTWPMVKAQLGADPTTAAALHTTTAATMIDGGAKVNILPQRASALVNYRIHPRDTAASVRDRAIRLVDDERVTIEAVGAREASPQSSTKSAGYHAIAEAIAAVFGAVPTAPFLTLQGTDSRHYADLADDNYRFTPFIYHDDDLTRIHGTDERILIEDLARGAAWYEDLLRRAGEAPKTQ